MTKPFRILLSALLLPLALLAGCVQPRATTSLSLTYPDRASLPPAFRPAEASALVLEDHPWTAAEEEASHRAALAGVEEMARYFDENPAAAASLGDNAIEAFLNATYAASPTPRLGPAAHAKAKQRLLAALSARAGLKEADDDWSTVITLASYASQLLGPAAPATRALVERANALLPPQALLEKLIEEDWRAVLAKRPVPNGEAYGLLIWLVVFLDARTVPGLALPADTPEFAADVWTMLRDYDFVEARERPEAFNDLAVYDDAYLATHIGYVPTGYGRHVLRIGDSPNLYRYLRENFYAVLTLGELDLVAEFVDLLRQYGATPANDIQVRHGVRHLMRLYAEAGGWIHHRESYEDPASNPYDLIHKPWTAISGVRPRHPLPASKGSYRAAFETWCRPYFSP